MRPERKELKCPWCYEIILASKVKVTRHRNDYGIVIERRCPKCIEVLAAYLKDEGDFLSRIRTFELS